MDGKERQTKERTISFLKRKRNNNTLKTKKMINVKEKQEQGSIKRSKKYRERKR